MPKSFKNVRFIPKYTTLRRRSGKFSNYRSVDKGPFFVSPKTVEVD
jgi:hypothetical protein|tara:strand:- start:374 stop:511 length:138 start_codon:yes stop_codon:yes gene_type:complete